MNKLTIGKKKRKGGDSLFSVEKKKEKRAVPKPERKVFFPQKKDRIFGERKGKTAGAFAAEKGEKLVTAVRSEGKQKKKVGDKKKRGQVGQGWQGRKGGRWFS